MTEGKITLEKYRKCSFALSLSRQVLLWVYSEAMCSRSELKPRLEKRMNTALTSLHFCSTVLEDLAEDDLEDSVLIGDVYCLGLDRQLLSEVLSIVEELGEGLFPVTNSTSKGESDDKNQSDQT
jgi:hypothetical protein